MGRLSKMEDLSHFHINYFSSSVKTICIQNSVFSTFQIIGGTTLFRITILNQTYKKKKRVILLMLDKSERSKIRFYGYFAFFPETIFKV